MSEIPDTLKVFDVNGHLIAAESESDAVGFYWGSTHSVGSIPESGPSGHRPDVEVVDLHKPVYDESLSDTGKTIGDVVARCVENGHEPPFSLGLASRPV